MTNMILLNEHTRSCRKRSRQYGYVHLIALAVLLIVGATVVRLSPFRIGMVVGESMTPTLQHNNLFVIDKGFYEHAVPSSGDIVVADAHGDTCVKRIAAGPGEDMWLLEYASDGADGRYSEVVNPPDLIRVRRLLSQRPQIGRLRHIRMPEGKVFLVGDAQTVSWDSRNYGPIPISRIIGRVYPLQASERPRLKG